MNACWTFAKAVVWILMVPLIAFVMFQHSGLAMKPREHFVLVSRLSDFPGVLLCVRSSGICRVVILVWHFNG